MLAELADVVLPSTAEQLRALAGVAASAGLPLVAYEGGQHLVGTVGQENDEKLTELFTAANRAPRMRQVYPDYLEAWKDAGGRPFVHFVDVGAWSKWGSWGSAECLTQPDEEAPKRAALREFARTHPRWW